MHLGEENIITATDVLPILKTLEPRKTTGCDEIRPEMIETLNHE